MQKSYDYTLVILIEKYNEQQETWWNFNKNSAKTNFSFVNS